jgi:hypothetical protein
MMMRMHHLVAAMYDSCSCNKDVVAAKTSGVRIQEEDSR